MALDKLAVLNATCKYAVLEDGGAEVSTNRVAITWTDDGSGGATVSGTESFTGTADAAVDAVGFYSAATAGTYYGNAPLSGDLAFNAEGNYDVTGLTISA